MTEFKLDLERELGEVARRRREIAPGGVANPDVVIGLMEKFEEFCKATLPGEIDISDMVMFAHNVHVYLLHLIAKDATPSERAWIRLAAVTTFSDRLRSADAFGRTS